MKETTDEETTDELVQGQTRQLPKNKFRSTEEQTTDVISHQQLGKVIRSCKVLKNNF